jgi:hypothetical protein
MCLLQTCNINAVHGPVSFHVLGHCLAFALPSQLLPRYVASRGAALEWSMDKDPSAVAGIQPSTLHVRQSLAVHAMASVGQCIAQLLSGHNK